jgi:hypothetical protein
MEPPINKLVELRKDSRMENKKDKKNGGISRRSFLKGATAAGLGRRLPLQFPRIRSTRPSTPTS